MNPTSTLLVFALLAAPSLALAQGAKVLKDKQAETYNEVERGFYLGVNAGPWFIVNPPVSGTSKQPFSAGQMAMVEVGMDFGERFSFGAFVMGTANRAGSDYTGKSGGLASGDFSAIAPGANVRANLIGFNDSQDVKRTWVYVRAGAGLMFFSPKTLIPDADVLLFGGPGVEYYTRLRHFSIGVEVTGAFMLTNAAIGFAITPNLRYAF
jgi:hypothetical protein